MRSAPSPWARRIRLISALIVAMFVLGCSAGILVAMAWSMRRPSNIATPSYVTTPDHALVAWLKILIGLLAFFGGFIGLAITVTLSGEIVRSFRPVRPTTQLVRSSESSTRLPDIQS